jgi:heterodisulfide reductase subunit B
MVCDALGIELREIDDWNCCGATSAHAIDEELAKALGVRNLIQAEKVGLSKIVVPCAACFNRLRHASVRLDAEGPPQGFDGFESSAEVIHLLELLSSEARLEQLEARRFNELHQLKVVCYYGCLIVRPPEVTGAKDPENPTSMDTIMARMGISVVSWPYKTRCCGSSMSMTRTETAERLCTELADMAVRAGADAIVTACPLCFVNLDTRQRRSAPLPIFYFTELMAIFMDLAGAKAMVRRHQVSPVPLLREKGIM